MLSYWMQSLTLTLLHSLWYFNIFSKKFPFFVSGFFNSLFVLLFNSFEQSVIGNIYMKWHCLNTLLTHSLLNFLHYFLRQFPIFFFVSDFKLRVYWVDINTTLNLLKNHIGLLTENSLLIVMLAYKMQYLCTL